MTQSTLRVGLLQVNLIWNNVEANLNAFERQLEKEEREVDLYILPEMFSTGFCMNPEEVDTDAGANSLAWLKAQAKKYGAGFCGSVLFRLEDGRFVNRMFLVDHKGEQFHYDKWHRFAMAGEDKAYATGSRLPVVAEFRGWKFLLQVCYDLRFPVYARNSLGGYDAVIYVANWPVTRRLHWRTLLLARAIENQAYCIGVNRVGKDGNGLDYVGDSLVINALGAPLLDMLDQEHIGTAEIELEHLDRTRLHLPFLADADTFKLHD